MSKHIDSADSGAMPAEGGPVVGISDAYGLLVAAEDMSPAFRPGDTAWVDPLLPYMHDTDVILYRAITKGESA